MELYNTNGEKIDYKGDICGVTEEMTDYFSKVARTLTNSNSMNMSVSENSGLPSVDFYIERKLPENFKHKEMDVICGVSFFVNQIDGRICGYNCFKYEPTKEGYNGKFTAKDLMEDRFIFPKDSINSGVGEQRFIMWSEYEKAFPEIKQLLMTCGKTLHLDLEHKDCYSSVKNYYMLLCNHSYIGDIQHDIYNNFKSLRDRMNSLGCVDKIFYKENTIYFTLDNGVNDYVRSFGSTLEYNGAFFNNVSSFMAKYFSEDGIDKKGILFEKWFGKDEDFKAKYYHPFFERPWEHAKDWTQVVELFDDYEKYGNDEQEDDFER